MKKFAILALAALMLIGPFASAAMAKDTFAKQTEALEGDRRRPPRPGNQGRRPPPRPNHNRDRGRDRDRHRGGSFAGALIGSAIGGLIAGAINDSQPDYYYSQPNYYYYQQPQQPVLVCDSYGNCWYQYQ